MKWFTNLKIKTKLVVCFIVLAIFTAIVGTVGISNMNTLNAKSNNMYQNNFLPAQNLATIQTALQDVRANQILAVYERDLNKLQSRLDAIAQLGERSNKLFADYEATIQDEEDKKLFDAVMSAMAQYREARNANLELMKQGNYDQALNELSKVTEARLKADEALQLLVDYNKKLAADTVALNAVNFKTQSMIMIGVIAAGIILAIGLGLMVASMISKPLNQIVKGAEKIADGDLDVTIDINTKDEVGVLATAFKKMTDNINEVMTNINSAAEQVASGSKQVSDSSIALSQGATEQASSVEQLTASLEEISAQTKQNAENANEANMIAEAAKANAAQGNSQMKEMLKAMDEINDSSSNISKIIKVIDEIAFQTNILALNAAVEAARAGQHGKGFAVVAEEVRNLAARSANAAKETTDMIEGSIKKVEGGTKIANQTADALNKIVEGITRVATLVGDIAVASNEQASGINQVNQGIMQVSEVVQTNSATSEESAAASEELSSQAEMLKDEVARFKLKKSQSSSQYRGTEEINPDVLRMLENMNSRKKSSSLGEAYEEAAVTSTKKIALSDREFGKY